VTAVTVWSAALPVFYDLTSRLRTILNDGITWCGTRSPLAELRANDAGSSVGKRLC
jgi:hypothetical protein